MSLQNERFRIDFSRALLTSPFHAAKGEIFILTDCICSSYQSTVAILDPAPTPTTNQGYLCLNETIKRADSPVSAITLWSNRAVDLSHNPQPPFKLIQNST